MIKRDVLLMFSGGLDSTGAFWKLMQDKRSVHVYHMNLNNKEKRSEAESSLSETLKLLRNESGSEITPSLLDELKRVTEKISHAVTIHLEAVNSARALRSKFIFRIFRLAGHAPLPVRYSFEDDIL